MKNKTKGMLCIAAPFSILFVCIFIRDRQAALQIIASITAAAVVFFSILYGLHLLDKPDGNSK